MSPFPGEHVRRWFPTVCLALASLGLGADVSAASRAVTFDGVYARDQDAQTMEKGLLRADLRTLRGMRDRTAVWMLAAPGDTWEADVAPALRTALAADPGALDGALGALPTAVLRAGPSLEGGQVRVKLDGGGDGLLSVHMPALLSDQAAGEALVNSVHPNKALFLAGFELKAGGPGVTAVHLPRGLRPMARGLPPQVPLVPIGAGASWVGLGDDDATGDEARTLRKELGRLQTVPSVPVDVLRETPRRSGSLTEWLRSSRLSVTALATPEGVYRTLTQAPSGWSTETRTVRHPTRHLALSAPLAVQGADGGGAAMVFAVIAQYTPLLLTLEEAPLWLGVDADAFARAVAGGEVPFLRDGAEVLFYRPWLDRWRAGGAHEPGGKAWSSSEAPAQVTAWGDKYKLKGLARAAEGALPMRMAPVPGSARSELIDPTQVAWAEAWSDDVAAWLKHLEPSLKQGKQAPLWAFAPASGGMLLEGSFKLPRGAVAQSGPSYLEGAGIRGAGGTGGGAERISGSAGGSVASAAAGAVAVEILEVYTGDAFCPLGRRADAGVAFAVDGVPEGQTVPLSVEWDLLMKGRSVRRDAFPVRREAGTHELDFEVPCPDEAGAASLEVALVDAGGAIVAEGTLALDARAYGGRSYAALRMPAPKQCVGADLAGGDEEFSVASTKGLSGAQVQAAVRGFQEQTLRCYEAGGGNGTVQLELHVGCDGVVLGSEVTADTTGDRAFAQCVADTFRYAPFPAHDREGGALFEVPLRYD